MPKIHPSHYLEEVEYGSDAKFCISCEVCDCHSPETLTRECENA